MWAMAPEPASAHRSVRTRWLRALLPGGFIDADGISLQLQFLVCHLTQPGIRRWPEYRPYRFRQRRQDRERRPNRGGTAPVKLGHNLGSAPHTNPLAVTRNDSGTTGSLAFIHRRLLPLAPVRSRWLTLGIFDFKSPASASSATGPSLVCKYLRQSASLPMPNWARIRHRDAAEAGSRPR